jgi:hypothetical protein
MLWLDPTLSPRKQPVVQNILGLFLLTLTALVAFWYLAHASLQAISQQVVVARLI